MDGVVVGLGDGVCPFLEFLSCPFEAVVGVAHFAVFHCFKEGVVFLVWGGDDDGFGF